MNTFLYNKKINQYMDWKDVLLLYIKCIQNTKGILD